MGTARTGIINAVNIFIVPHTAMYRTFFGNNVVSEDADEPGVEDSTLQTLDRPTGAGGVTFNRDMFEKTVVDWEKIPLVFAQKHPDLHAFAKDPEAAAKSVGGRIVGEVGSPHIKVAGHPRLQGRLNINDNEVIDLWKEGKLSLSTAFFANDNGKNLTSPPVPNHVLLFVESPGSMPRDLGAFVNTETEMPDKTDGPDDVQKPPRKTFRENLKEALMELFNGSDTSDTATPTVSSTKPTVNTGSLPEPKTQDTPTMTNTPQDLPETMVAILNQKIEEVTKECEALKRENATYANAKTEVEKLEAEIADLKAKLAAAEKELEGYKADEATEKFNMFVNTLPAGKTATQEMKDKLREEWDKDPAGTMLKEMVNMSSQSHGGATQRVGHPHVNTGDFGDSNGIDDPGNWDRSKARQGA